MKLNIASFVIAVIAAVAAILAIDPNTLGPRLLAYGTLAATGASYLLWPAIIALGVAAQILSRRVGAYLGTRARAAQDRYFNNLVDERIKAHKRELANIDQTTIAEMLVRSPAQMDTLAGHLGIGKPSTGADSVKVRLERLERNVAASDDLLTDVRAIGAHIGELQQAFNVAQIWNREQFERRDIVAALKERWPTIRDHAAVIATYFDEQKPGYDWRTWFSLRDRWNDEYDGWSALFPNLQMFDAVRDVREVSGVDVATSHTQNAKNFRFGEAQQENAYFTFLAVYERFKHEAPTALNMMQMLASINTNR